MRVQLKEYEEIIARKTNARLAANIIYLILNSKSTLFFDPHYCFHLIEADEDDNKFVDCAICANASFIVSEDAHFRILDEIDFPKVSLLRLTEFVEKLQEK